MMERHTARHDDWISGQSVQYVVPVDNGGRRTHVYQQSVTMLAKMAGDDNDTVTPSSAPGWLKLSGEDAPLVVALISSGLLVLLLLTTLMMWRCCKLHRNKEKAYCLEHCNEEHYYKVPSPTYSGLPSATNTENWSNPSYYQSGSISSYILSSGQTEEKTPSRESSTILVSTKGEGDGLRIQSKLVGKSIPRSQSAPLGKLTAQIQERSYHPSEGIHESRNAQTPTGRHQPRRSQSQHHPHRPQRTSSCSSNSKRDSRASADVNTLYASSSVLESCSTQSTRSRSASGTEAKEIDPDLKSRSLPSWVRSKQRPLSTEDDLNNLYAKVNLSKKRRNRMRNDTAAIIAMTKSRSQLNGWGSQSDTDTLVRHEAEVVYDERTDL